MKKLLIILFAIIFASGISIATYFGLSQMGAVNIENKTELTISIEDEEKQYDGEPLTAHNYVLDGELNSSHSIVINYTGEQVYVGASKSNASVQVVDEKGKDVSGKYDISIKSGELKVVKRNLDVTCNDVQVEYNGKEIENLDYKLANETTLAKGDKLAATINCNQVDVGVIDSSLINIDPIIYNSLGVNVTDNYNIEFECGNIEIVERELFITPLVTEKEYDGKAFTCDNYVITKGSLVEGHKIKEIKYAETIVNVGTITTDLVCTIIDENGEDVTANYKINNNYSQFDLVIDKKDVTINLPSNTKEYIQEGYYDYLNKAIGNLTNIPEGVTLELKKNDKTYLNVDEYEITQDDITIAGEYASNYNIIITSGEFIIAKKNVVMYLPVMEKDYDGNAFTSAQFIEEITYSYEKMKVTYDEVKFPEDKDVTQRNYTITNYTITDGKDNYSVSIMPGTIIINPKEAKITLPTIKQTYGKKLDKATIKNQTTFTGITENDFEIVNLPENFDVDTYQLTSKNISYTSNEIEKNYKFTVENGSIQIEKATATINYLTANNSTITRTYKGERYVELNKTDFEVVSETAKASVLSYSYEKLYQLSTDVKVNKSLAVTLKDIVLIDPITSRDITNNFNITIQPINVKYVEIDLTIRPTQFSGTYGDKIYYNPYNILDDSYKQYLAPGDYIDPDYYTYYDGVINYGDYDYFYRNINTPDIFNAYGDDVTDFYNIMIDDNVELDIKPRTVNVYMPNLSYEYDENKTTYDYENKINAAIFVNNTVEGEELTFTFNGDNLNTVPGNYVMTSVDDRDINKNHYTVNVVPGTLTITKKTCSIYFPKLSKTYDGNVFEEIDIENNTSFVNISSDDVTLNIGDVGPEKGVYILSINNVEYDKELYNLTVISGEITIE